MAHPPFQGQMKDCRDVQDVADVVGIVGELVALLERFSSELEQVERGVHRREVSD
jgi:hypothetical protein